MMYTLSYGIFETASGWVGLAASPSGLCRSTLPHPTPEAARQELRLPGGSRPAVTDFTALIGRIREYFEGRPVDFTEPVYPAPATPFQRSVWEAARRIPYGETRSYSWLAAEMGNAHAARAVGQALGRNPLPIVIPCHRVVTTAGRLGGFRGGTALKERLLALEAAGISRASGS